MAPGPSLLLHSSGSGGGGNDEQMAPIPSLSPANATAEAGGAPRVDSNATSPPSVPAHGGTSHDTESSQPLHLPQQQQQQRKWCAACGNVIEAQATTTRSRDATSLQDVNLLTNPTSSTTTVIVAATAPAPAAAPLPSPSSIAFAPPGFHTSSLAQALLQASSGSATRSIVASAAELAENIHADRQRRPICTACAVAVSSVEVAAPRGLQADASENNDAALDQHGIFSETPSGAATPRATATLGGASGASRSMQIRPTNISIPPAFRVVSSRDTASGADVTLTLDPISVHETANTGAAPSAPGEATNSPRTSPTRAWRPAPWANLTTSPVRSGPISIGAGDDTREDAADISLARSVDSIAEDLDFPPLSRVTSSPPNIAHASSVWAPSASPTSIHSASGTRTRGRSFASSTQQQPALPSLAAGFYIADERAVREGRTGSFSRSQSSTGQSHVGDGPNEPMVNFGRSRAVSSGAMSASSSISGSAAGGGGGSRIRRLSSRRLSRSGSSTCPTAQSFAASLAETTPIPLFEFDSKYGPAGMTRPRIGTLGAAQLRARISSRTGAPLHQELPNALDAKVYVDGDGDDAMREDATKEEGEGIAKHTSWFNVRKPDPLPELSRKRLPPQGIGCLYPGALFTGTQRSGRSTYDVSVRIVNVDLPSSMLCGYLNIRGLTEDWPELTTYFDAEIIGSKHGFITGKWGATEADDQKHWSRFLPFRPLKPALVKPALTFNHLNKPYVFMRWKERFLVPDHRVRERDINGASYAGFYYVCVELGDDNLSRYFTSPSSSSAAAAGSSPPTSPGVQLRRPQSQTRGRLSDAHTSGYWTTVGAAPPAHGNVTVSSIMTDPSSPTSPTLPDMASIAEACGMAGRMSGYYFHENSEPYQQLSLAHVPERSSSYFELR